MVDNKVNDSSKNLDEPTLTVTFKSGEEDILEKFENLAREKGCRIRIVMRGGENIVSLFNVKDIGDFLPFICGGIT